MWLQALLTLDDVSRILAEVTPLRIGLSACDPQRHLWLAPPSSVTLVPERGVRIVSEAKLCWGVIGIPVPTGLKSVQVLITPEVVEVDGQHELSFRLQLEEADLTLMPQLVQDSVVARVNEALAHPDARLSWSFIRTLDWNFKLPDRLRPLSALHLFARWGKVRVQADGVALAIGFDLTAEHDEHDELRAPSAFVASDSVPPQGAPST